MDEGHTIPAEDQVNWELNFHREIHELRKQLQSAALDSAAQAMPWRSLEIGKWSAAMAKAQTTATDPIKTKTADVRSQKGSYKFDYATLADGLQVWREHYATQGLSLSQNPRVDDGLMFCLTLISHTSGEYVSSMYPVCRVGDLSQQSMGSAYTYARRYSLFGMIGVAPEDDDGNAAEGNTAVVTDKTRAKAAPKATTKKAPPVKKTVEKTPEPEKQERDPQSSQEELLPTDPPEPEQDEHEWAQDTYVRIKRGVDQSPTLVTLEQFWDGETANLARLKEFTVAGFETLAKQCTDKKVTFE